MSKIGNFDFQMLHHGFQTEGYFYDPFFDDGDENNNFTIIDNNDSSYTITFDAGESYVWNNMNINNIDLSYEHVEK